MGSHEECSLASMYHEPYDFSLSVHEDADTFMNVREFAALHDIDGQKIPCVVTSAEIKDSTQEAAYSLGLVLWVKNEYVAQAYSGMGVRVDGKQYVIEDARLIQGEMWRIMLGVSDG